jgi:uncharacterized membrane protein YeaQ/YmgE (transglycosylase-associated protein family)
MTLALTADRKSRGSGPHAALLAILIGFIAGIIAKMITPGTGPSGFWLTAALGIAGSKIATNMRRA